LNQLRNERETIFKEREGLIAIQRAQNERVRAARQEQKKMRAELKFTNINDIDNEIKRLEYKHSTESMGLKQEKELIKSIETLKSKRKEVERYNAKVGRMNEQNSNNTDVRSRLDELTKQLDAVRAKFNKQRELLEGTDDQFSSQSSQYDTLRKQRDDATAAINELHKEHQTVWSKWNTENDAWRKYQNELRKQRNERRKAEEEEYKKELEKKRIEREKELAAMKPWLEEIALCDYLTGYLQKLVGGSNSTKGSSAATEKTKPKMDGMVAISRKNDDYMMMGGGKKKRGKKGKKKQAKLVHSIDMIQSFSLLQLTPPVTTADVEKTVTALKEKRDYYDTLPRDAAKKETSSKKKVAAKSSEKSENGEKFPILPGSKESSNASNGESWGKTPPAAPVETPAAAE